MTPIKISSIRQIAHQLAKSLSIRVVCVLSVIVLLSVLGTSAYLEYNRITSAAQAVRSHLVNAILLGDNFELERIAGSLVTGDLIDSVVVLDAKSSSALVSDGSVKLLADDYVTGFHLVNWVAGYSRKHDLIAPWGETIGTLILFVQLSIWPVFLSIFLVIVSAWCVYRIIHRLLDRFSDHLIEPIKSLPHILEQNRGRDRREAIEEFQWLIDEIEGLRSKENQLHAIQGQIKENQALFRLSSQVAHDLRSPLSSLQAAGRLLKAHVGNNAEAVEVLNMLQLSGKRLEDIANDLLDKNKEAGDSRKIFSIHEVLDELVGELRSSPLGAGTEFKKNYHNSALYVTGDKTGISRAIGNIIKNALEAMQKNPVERPRQLTVVTTVNTPSPPCPVRGEPSPLGEGVVIRITDTGPGIPADKIPLILQGGYTEGKADGHGIGTRVVKEMVEAHKGSLAIESEVGVGATFILTLPSADAASIPQDSATVTIPHSANGTISVIDDEASVREQWRLTLRALGVEARLFGCWEEFVACHTSDSSVATPPQNDISATFIVDYQFNNSAVDGLEIIRRLKERGYAQFIMATAEYWKPAIKEATQKSGITLCPKPLPRVVMAKQTPLLCKEGLGEVETLPHPTSPYPLRGPCVGEEKNGAPNVLVIDDDAGIRMCWKVQRKQFGIDGLHLFASMEECEINKLDYSRIDLAFIDKHIEGSAWKLDKLIAHLKQNGVGKVWIASGETAQDLQNDPACAAADGIVKGKMPESIDPYQ